MTEFHRLLSTVATGQVSPIEGFARLSAYAAVDIGSNPASVVYRSPIPEGEALLLPSMLSQVLERFLADDWDASMLRDWARFIVLTGRFSSPLVAVEDDDRYDPMWNAVYDLSLPDIHGPITKDKASNLLESLLGL